MDDDDICMLIRVDDTDIWMMMLYVVWCCTDDDGDVICTMLMY